VAEEMKNKYKISNNYVFPNAIYIPLELKIKNEKIFKFIFVGRIEEGKGLDLAISALVEFHKKYPEMPFHFDIYGQEDKTYLLKCKNLSKSIIDKISFHGNVQNRNTMYDKASVLLMPTRVRETFGLVIIEAMAQGCVVIATDAYGPSEIIDDKKNGLLFEPNNKNDLLNQIILVYFNRNLFKKLQRNGYEHVKKNYNILHVKPKIESLLKAIVKNLS
jgi:glycosyltransferase involved in cell wall biosynthesis